MSGFDFISFPDVLSGTRVLPALADSTASV